MNDDSQAENFSACRSCGACCATLRITLPRIELESRGGQVPDAFTENYTPTTACMREHPDIPGRCIALRGAVGVEVTCTIYARRPEACREFAPLAALGYGDDACDEARRGQGLAPLGAI